MSLHLGLKHVSGIQIPLSGMNAIAAFLGQSVRQLRGNTYADIDAHTAEVRWAIWNDLIETGTRLSNLFQYVFRHNWSAGMGLLSVLRRLKCMLDQSGEQLPGLLESLRTAQRPCGQSEAGRCLLSVGSGGPGRLGFADATGSTTVWAPLLDGKCGVITAIEALDLDLIALPGARLPAKVSLPRNAGYCLCSRGGPSYGSTAWIWKLHLDTAIMERSDLGSNRRLWISFACGKGIVFHFCCVYLPPFEVHGKNEDAYADFNF